MAGEAFRTRRGRNCLQLSARYAASIHTASARLRRIYHICTFRFLTLFIPGNINDHKGKINADRRCMRDDPASDSLRQTRKIS